MRVHKSRHHKAAGPFTVIALAATVLGGCDRGAPPPQPKVAPAALAPAAPVTATRPAEVRRSPDEALAAKVRDALTAAPGLSGHAFDVTASSGRVSLFGTAASEAKRRDAGRIAAAVDGVNSLDNQIKIVSGS